MTDYSAYLDELKTLLTIPSVSTDPSRKDEVRQCAEWVKQHLATSGLDGVALYETKGHPIVYGEWCHAPDAPTVLIYGHYDVQPAEPLELWTSPPFEPEVRDGFLYARGASDDKGQVFAHMVAVRECLSKNKALPVNVKFLIEGEEEIGSPHLIEFVAQHQDLLRADIGVISDTPMYAPGQPSICLGLRGLVYCEVHAKATTSDLHSGQHGGVTQNPILALAEILNALKDDQHRITIPGFYEGVPELSDDLRGMLSCLDHSDTEYADMLGTSALVGEAGFSTLERKWFRPTLDCNGIIGGFTGEGAKTVIPAHAMAKVSMRLVGTQDPHRIMAAAKAYIEELAPPGVEVRVHEHSAGSAYMMDPDHPMLVPAKNALTQAFGQAPVLQGEGGSIPILTEMKQILGIDFLLLGLNFMDDNIHAPNERFLVDNFYKGITMSGYLLEEMGKVGPQI